MTDSGTLIASGLFNKKRQSESRSDSAAARLLGFSSGHFNMSEAEFNSNLTAHHNELESVLNKRK